MNTDINTDMPKDRRQGRCYNKEELRKNFKKITDETLGNFDFQLQELQYELDTNNQEIDTKEIRSILKGIEQLCDDIDDLVDSNNIIIVDIDVSNCKIIAFKPEIQTLMPNDDVGKNLFWNTVELERLDKRVIGELKGEGLKKAQEIVNKYGSINTTGIYGSIEINENDFIPSKNED